MHWPSEHTVDGCSFAGELHLVHIHTRYRDLEEAKLHSEGVAVVAVLITETKKVAVLETALVSVMMMEASNAEVEKIALVLPSIQLKGEQVKCAVCSVQSSVCSVLCAVCSLQCAACSVQSSVCSVQCAACCVHGAVCSVPCAGPDGRGGEDGGAAAPGQGLPHLPGLPHHPWLRGGRGLGRVPRANQGLLLRPRQDAPAALRWRGQHQGRQQLQGPQASAHGYQCDRGQALDFLQSGFFSSGKLNIIIDARRYVRNIFSMDPTLVGDGHVASLLEGHSLTVSLNRREQTYPSLAEGTYDFEEEKKIYFFG